MISSAFVALSSAALAAVLDTSTLVSDDVAYHQRAIVLAEQSQNICGTDGNVDSIWVDKVNDSMSLVPVELKEVFKKSGWSMSVTDIDIDEVHFGGKYGAVMGMTDTLSKTIIIEDRQDAVTESPVHEFGHFMDYWTKMQSSTSEFKEIYNAETDAFKSAFFVNFHYDHREFLAEGIWKYFTDGERLQASCPRLYRYIDGLVEKMKCSSSLCKPCHNDVLKQRIAQINGEIFTGMQQVYDIQQCASETEQKDETSLQK